MSSRIQNIDTRLDRFIESRRELPFAWGANDCCLFAADWVREVTGLDLAAPLRGTYADALTAARIVHCHGGIVSLIAEFGAPIGIARIDPTRAKRGNLVVRNLGRGDCVGVICGANAAFLSESGLIFPSMSNSGPLTCFTF